MASLQVSVFAVAVACSGLASCDDAREAPSQAAGPLATASATDPRPTEAAPDADAPPASAAIAPRDPWSEVLDERVLQDGRLGPGSKLVALPTITAAADVGCAACSLAGKPTMIVAAALDDPRAERALQDLDAIHRFYADDGLAALAVLAPANADRLVTPPDPRAAIDRALALGRRLRLALPLHVPARVDDGGNRVWEDYYAVHDSPLVLLVGDRAIVELLPSGVASRDNAGAGSRNRPE